MMSSKWQIKLLSTQNLLPRECTLQKKKKKIKIKILLDKNIICHQQTKRNTKMKENGHK